MSEYSELDLPYDMSVDDLRYLRLWPEDESDFERQAQNSGWDVCIDEGDPRTTQEAYYALSRPVSPFFDDAAAAELQAKIGIIDDCDEVLDGYSLHVQRPGEGETFPFTFTHETTRLFFEFEGLPNQKTMKVLENLLSEYTRSRKTLLLSYLLSVMPNLGRQ